MEFIKLNNNNLSLLKDFISDCGTSTDTFSYFSKRPFEVVLNHKICILLKEKDDFIGYGHIDFFENKNWLGICVKEKFKGMGYGRVIMNELISFCKNEKINPITLSVMKINSPAIYLYESLGFKHVSKNDYSYFMELKND